MILIQLVEDVSYVPYWWNDIFYMRYNEYNEIYMLIQAKFLPRCAWELGPYPIKYYILEVSIFVFMEIFTGHTPC